jgi:hypothetical protein
VPTSSVRDWAMACPCSLTLTTTYTHYPMQAHSTHHHSAVTGRHPVIQQVWGVSLGATDTGWWDSPQRTRISVPPTLFRRSDGR